MVSIDGMKKNAGIYAAQFVKDGMSIGLGTGSTVYWLIQELGNKVKNGMNLQIVPTSKQTESMAAELNIPVLDLDDVDQLSLTIDGADEIDPQLQLIKGGGGALLQEKIVAAATEEFIVIADSRKLVKKLGKFPLPVEVIPFGYKQVIKKINQLGCEKILLRKKNDHPFISDHGHYIIDCYFEKIENPYLLNQTLHAIPGIVETGLFINMATKAIVAFDDGTVKTISRE